ncbi:MAG: protein phosphatase 2C domain-containing protein [Coriobacteriia bacterium]|nr:protein phosphatase 2C domain-containing protein [Coriobacteriia bacterium]
MQIAGKSIAGPRPLNEDNYYYFDFSKSPTQKTFTNGITAFLMVSDGMGGHEGGDVASAIACNAAESYMNSLLALEGDFIELNVPFALNEIVATANEAIAEYSAEHNMPNMGATFVGAFIGTNKTWIGHVGDSRAYKISRGKMTQLTRDHSMIGKMLADGLLTEEQAQHHPNRNAIERALGFTDDGPEINELYFGRGEALLLCSDGLSSIVCADEMAQCVLVSESIDDAVDDLLSLAEKKNTDDNATVVMATRSWTSMKARAPKPSTSGKLAGGVKLGKLFSSSRSKVIAAFAVCLCAAVIALLIMTFASSGGGGGGGGGGGVMPVTTVAETQPAPEGGEENSTADSTEVGAGNQEPIIAEQPNLASLQDNTSIMRTKKSPMIDDNPYLQFVNTEGELKQFPRTGNTIGGRFNGVDQQLFISLETIELDGDHYHVLAKDYLRSDSDLHNQLKALLQFPANLGSLDTLKVEFLVIDTEYIAK